MQLLFKNEQSVNFLFSIETSVYIRFSEKLTQSDDELIISLKYITDRALDFLPAVGFFLSPQSIIILTLVKITAILHVAGCRKNLMPFSKGLAKYIITLRILIVVNRLYSYKKVFNIRKMFGKNKKEMQKST